MNNTLRIDKEFQELIPSLSHEERAGLEQNLIENGCLDPLKVWKETNILLDGHNRYDICTRHNIPFDIAYISFASRDAAYNWIINTQLDRRNITEEQRKYLRGKRYTAEKKQAGAPLGNDNAKKQLDQNDPVVSTAAKIAREYGVSEPTIKRDEKYSQGIDVIAKIEPKQKIAILSGKSQMTNQEIQSFAGGLTEEQARTQLQELHEKRRKREEQKQKRQDTAKSLETATDVSLTALTDIKTKYRVIYADPPWKYGNDYTQAMPGSTRPEDHYVTMSTSEICQLPIKSLALNDAVLFLWGTSPLLEDALQVIKAWGFTYKTTFIWDKIKHNFGHYNSVRHEILFIATRGSCTPDNKTLYDSVQSIERTEHSRKPERFREIIDDLYQFGNKLELFSRQPVKGWDSWGNEI